MATEYTWLWLDDRGRMGGGGGRLGGPGGRGGDRWGDTYSNNTFKKMIALYDYDPQELSPNVDAEVRTKTTLYQIRHHIHSYYKPAEPTEPEPSCYVTMTSRDVIVT